MKSYSCVLGSLALALLLFVIITPQSAESWGNDGYYYNGQNQQPSYEALNQRYSDFRNLIPPRPRVEKKASWNWDLDFGLERGHSANELARIRQAQALANDPYGPGKKKRDAGLA